jgi:hypothetical protein
VLTIDAISVASRRLPKVDTGQQKRMARIARRYPRRSRRSSAYRWKAVAKDSASSLPMRATGHATLWL